MTRSIRLIRSLIGDYGGRVMNVTGDGVLALFESASEALRFAVTIQRELRNDVVWNADDEPVAFRIGINVGEVLVDEEANVQGRSVNVAARIQALAQPGGICVSEAVRRAVHDTWVSSLRSLGLRTLKNIAEPVEMFAIEMNGPQLPQPASLLPAAQSVGREPGPARRSRRPRWRCCPWTTCRGIRATSICVTESPATSSPISAGSAISW